MVDYAKSPDWLNRNQIAHDLGITYATLRVYERAIASLLRPAIGKNRTRYFHVTDLSVFKNARLLKAQGFRFDQLVNELHRSLVPVDKERPWETRCTMITFKAAVPPDDDPNWFPFSSTTIAECAWVVWRRRRP